MIGGKYLKLKPHIDIVMVHWRHLDVLGSTPRLIAESSSLGLKLDRTSTEQVNCIDFSTNQ